MFTKPVAQTETGSFGKQISFDCEGLPEFSLCHPL
jgi:hypothetical protein